MNNDDTINKKKNGGYNVPDTAIYKLDIFMRILS